MTRAVLLLLGTTVALAACGRPGPPRAPGPPDAIVYPRVYPYEPPARAPAGAPNPAPLTTVPGPATTR